MGKLMSPLTTLLSTRARHVAFHERKFGVIFDRLRLAYHAGACMSEKPAMHAVVDGTGRAIDVANWVNRTVEKVTRKAVAA